MSKAQRRLRRTVLDYRRRRLNQFLSQGLSNKAIKDKIAGNKYLTFCMGVR